MTGKRGQYVGNGEMKCSTTEELSESTAEGEKGKKDRLRYLLKKEVRMTLSEAEKKEKKALQNE